MKNRYSFMRFRGDLIVSQKMRRRLERSGKGNKLRMGDIFTGAAVLILVNFDIFPEGIPHAEWIQLFVAVVVLLVGLFLNFRRLAPRPCWSRAAMASGMWAAVMTLLPFLLYWLDEFDIQLAYQIAAASSVVWLVCLGSLLRLRYVRRRSRAEIAAMRLRAKRQRRLEYL